MTHHNLALAAAFLATLLVADPAAANSPETTGGATATAPQSDGISTGSVDSAARRSKEKRYEDCMAAWDKGTHMTKKQWSRTCRTSMDEFPEL